MTKPIDGVKDYCIYLFDDSHTYYGEDYKSNEPYWCKLAFSGDHTKPCTIKDYWECATRKMYEERRNAAQGNGN